MTDQNLDPVLDLSIATLAKACRGDVSKLPSFVVHDDEAWPWFNKVRPAKGKIHIRRSSFNRVVVGQVPVRPGLWLRVDAQEFFIDLQPHHLGGATPAGEIKADAQAARQVVKADEAGRLPDEESYGAEIVERRAVRQVERGDLERVEADPERGSVRSSVLSRGGGGGSVAMGDDD
jgi:hypothetical protein